MISSISLVTTRRPAATARTAERSAALPVVLGMTPVAPAASAAASSLAVVEVVRTSTFAPGREATIWRVASTPSITGIRMSITTTSGLSLFAALTPSSPFLASPTTSRFGCAFSSATIPIRTIAWSSTTSTLVFSIGFPFA